MDIASKPPLEVVELVIDKLKSSGSNVVIICGPGSPPRPLTDLERQRVEAHNPPFPPSLRRWLEFDAAGLELFDDGGPRVTTLLQFVFDEMADVLEELGDEADELGDGVGSGADAIRWMLQDYEDLADTPALRLPPSASQAHVLVLDGTEEPPVLGFEKEELWQKYNDFGAYAAHMIGGIDYERV